MSGGGAGPRRVLPRIRRARHLDCRAASKSKSLSFDSLDVLVIENVGNLVCPASYDLGEDVRVVLLSVTEGEDKPLKYPIMFRTAQVVVVNKTVSHFHRARPFDSRGARRTSE